MRITSRHTEGCAGILYREQRPAKPDQPTERAGQTIRQASSWVIGAMHGIRPCGHCPDSLAATRQFTSLHGHHTQLILNFSILRGLLIDGRRLRRTERQTIGRSRMARTAVATQIMGKTWMAHFMLKRLRLFVSCHAIDRQPTDCP